MAGLKSYLKFKHQQETLFQKALKDRQKAKKQITLLKLIKVGAYWQKRGLTCAEDILMKQAFCKWMHTENGTNAPSPVISRITHSLPKLTAKFEKINLKLDS